MGGNEQQFCLRWNNHQSTLISVFEALLESETLVDVTLAAEGRYLKAHKVVLCACSPFFQDLLSNHLEKYPIIVLKDVTFQELKALIDYMYRGEVNVSQEQLAALIKTAESLKIKGLADGGDKNKKSSSSASNTPAATSPAPPPPPPSLPAPLPPIAPSEIHNSPVNNILREGSMSPISRKRRKRSRRRSGDSLELAESVDSSLSEPPLAVGGEREDKEDLTTSTTTSNKERVIRALGLVPPSALLSTQSTALLEPKAEVEDVDEESIDLMLDEDASEDKAREADARPGPSHEGLQSAGGSLNALYTLVDRTRTLNHCTSAPTSTYYNSTPPSVNLPPNITSDPLYPAWVAPPVYVPEKFTMQASGRDVEMTTRKYPASIIKQALEEVIKDGLSMSKASEKFGIKRPTLYFYFKKLFPDAEEFNKKLSHVLY